MPGPKPHAPFKAGRATLPGQSFRFGEARRPISGGVAGSWRSMPSFGREGHLREPGEAKHGCLPRSPAPDAGDDPKSAGAPVNIGRVSTVASEWERAGRTRQHVSLRLDLRFHPRGDRTGRHRIISIAAKLSI